MCIRDSSYTDRKGRLKIKIKVDSIDGESYCRKNILPTISEFIRTPLSISQDGCTIDPETNECSIVMEETYKYNVSSFVSFSVKDGEKLSLIHIYGEIYYIVYSGKEIKKEKEGIFARLFK